MRQFLQFVGTVVFFGAWPVFWAYHRVVPGRTRVVLVHEGKVLVMKQWISNGKWTLPGGGLHRGEDPAMGAVREVREETHLQLDPRQLALVGQAVHRQYGLGFAYVVFATAVGTASVRAQRIEVSELVWAYPDELTLDNASPDTLRALQMVREKHAM